MALKIQAVTLNSSTIRVTCSWTKIGTTTDITALVYCYPRIIELDAVRITPNSDIQQIYFDVPSTKLLPGVKIFGVLKAGEVVMRGSITYVVPPPTPSSTPAPVPHPNFQIIYLSPLGGANNAVDACTAWDGGDKQFVHYGCLPITGEWMCKLYTNQILTILAAPNKYWSDGTYYYTTNMNSELSRVATC